MASFRWTRPFSSDGQMRTFPDKHLGDTVGTSASRTCERFRIREGDSQNLWCTGTTVRLEPGHQARAFVRCACELLFWG